MARSVREVYGSGGEPVFAGRDQISCSQSRHFACRSKGAKVDAAPTRRIYTCGRQISPFSCAAPASQGSFRANEKVHMTRQFTLTLVAALLVNVSPICRAAYAAQAEPEVVNGVAAVVNGDVIT